MCCCTLVHENWHALEFVSSKAIQQFSKVNFTNMLMQQVQECLQHYPLMLICPTFLKFPSNFSMPICWIFKPQVKLMRTLLSNAIIYCHYRQSSICNNFNCHITYIISKLMLIIIIFIMIMAKGEIVALILLHPYEMHFPFICTVIYQLEIPETQWFILQSISLCTLFSNPKVLKM